MILATASTLLFLSFIVHLLWWRKKMPVHTTGILLLIFFGVFTLAMIILMSILWKFERVSLTFPEMMRLALLYISCALVYIILYSAIEQQSPTLAMIDYINKTGKSGCDDESLVQYLSAGNEIKKRLSLMEQGGWLIFENAHWHLTRKGRQIACLFNYAASIFGLKRGG